MADEEVAAEAVVEQPKPEAEVVAEPAQEELPLETKTEEEAKPEVKTEEAEPKAEEPAPEEPKSTGWERKELDRKHRQIQEARRLLAEKDAEIQALRAGQPIDQQPAPAPTGQPITQANGRPIAPEVRAEAQRIVDEQAYQSNLNKADKAGTETYGEEWKTAIENLTLKGGFVESPDTMRMILATSKKYGEGAPAKILYELGRDPNKFDALMALPFDERVFEMAELAKAPVQPKKLSAAPAPVAPVGGRAAPAATTLTDGLDDDKWYAIRGAQKQKNYDKRNGIRR